MNPKSGWKLSFALVFAGIAAYAIVRINPGKTYYRHIEHESRRGAEQAPMPHGGEIDHDNPENQRRMAIFHYNEGNKFLRREDWNEAIRNYEMALRHHRDIPDVYVNLSTAQLKTRAFDKARETLATLGEKTPDHPALFYNLACYHALTGRIDTAWESLQKAATLGFKGIEAAKTDPDLAPLRADPRYAEWIKNL